MPSKSSPPWCPNDHVPFPELPEEAYDGHSDIFTFGATIQITSDTRVSIDAPGNLPTVVGDERQVTWG